MKIVHLFYLLCVSVMMQANGMMDLMHKVEHMLAECVSHRHCGSCSTTSTQQYNVEVKDKNESVEIALNLGKDVAGDEISIEVEDDTLYVNVVSGNDTIDLQVADQRLKMSILSQQTIENRHSKAMSRSQSCQMMSLPAVDMHRQSPKADLADGVLTLTFAKKSAQKILVNVTKAETAQAVSETKEEELDK